MAPIAPCLARGFILLEEGEHLLKALSRPSPWELLLPGIAHHTCPAPLLKPPSLPGNTGWLGKPL